MKLLPKRVWRAAKRIGEERVQECREAAVGDEQPPLPAQRQSPSGEVPLVASVQMDGGRFQERERVVGKVAASKDLALKPSESESDPHDQGFWHEYKAGVLMSMTSEMYAEDPCPELPATFATPGKMREIAREIKGFTHESQVSIEADEEAGPDFKQREGRPKTLVKSVVATSGDVEAFGPLLACAAHERKQVNRRIKGTEKFWSDGANPMLHLVADRLSQTNASTNFWSRRLDRLIQSAIYHQAA